ncbi:hypothetical protein BcepSauron_431 [Burkholderia phage BcepSauron]|uniref:Uncharacterized protein n=2 Tax=Sarumanvirus TaxID=2843450 RepID=A0A482ML77_9CAUD|nr:hypothetical protein H1O16_gp429 [Burkholderia phage BcepSaruman]YP_009904809.1 hypothetical protein H1O17_gp431 [Burkholderia phage BcepSauron]QBQ74811.1 hypothetical protein BcepSauron_431 [Burkholderia phage BcepSauron]QBX06842.1 hypothetical protein BcepSaruman_429 [Burkholderia phage BcepSaruman]
MIDPTPHEMQLKEIRSVLSSDRVIPLHLLDDGYYWFVQVSLLGKITKFPAQMTRVNGNVVFMNGNRADFYTPNEEGQFVIGGYAYASDNNFMKFRDLGYAHERSGFIERAIEYWTLAWNAITPEQIRRRVDFGMEYPRQAREDQRILEAISGAYRPDPRLERL